MQGKESVLFFLAFLLASCGQPDSASKPEQPLSTTILEFDWYEEFVTPAGSMTYRYTSDGALMSELFIHWNNREWRTTTEMQLADNGVIESLYVTGQSAFGAPIDERFEFEGGVARWSTLADEGNATSDGSAFYVPSETGTPALRVLTATASRNENGIIDLLPSGSARAEKLTETTIDTSEGQMNASLWATTGLSFAPSYQWMDDDMRLIAVDTGVLGTIRRGIDPSVLRTLAAIQAKQNAELERRRTAELALRLSKPLVIQNGNVVDVEAGVLKRRHHVRIVDGTIEQISASPIELQGAAVVEASGLTLIPGLWDMHGHFPLSDGILNIAGGITSVRDVGNVHERIMELTEAYDSGLVIGPNTYRAGFMDKAGPYAAGWPVETLEEALERVDFYARNGYIQVKLYDSIDPKWVPAIAERTHARGMRLSGHIPAFMSAEQAVKAGYDEIQHINMVFLNFLAGDKRDTRQQLRFTLFGDEGGNLDLTSEPVTAFLDLLKANDVVVDPTAAIFNEQATHGLGQPNPIYASIIDHLPPTVARRQYQPLFDRGDRAADWERTARKQAAMLKAMHDHRIQLVAGSDAIAAFTIHRELELYVEAGIPNADVLRIATLDSARVTGVAQRTGSIRVGKDADLLLLEGNPLEDISAIRRAKLVIKGDTVYKPDALFRESGVKPFVPATEVLNL